MWSLEVLEENIGSALHDSVRKDSICPRLKAKNWQVLPKTISSYTANEIISRIKRKLAELERIFACYTADRGLISRIRFEKAHKIEKKKETMTHSFKNCVCEGIVIWTESSQEKGGWEISQNCSLSLEIR